MKDSKLHIAVVIGSTREGRFGVRVARWFIRQLERRDDMTLDAIDLADAGLPDRLADASPPEVEALSPRLAAADAFVFITPEYNHSYPASIKTLIDWHFDEWQAKPVALVSYGGVSGGLRAVEHLRHVFAEVHAVAIRNTVSFHNPWKRFDEDGVLAHPADAEQAAGAMLDQLAWWARALRDARTARPYKA